MTGRAALSDAERRRLESYLASHVAAPTQEATIPRRPSGTTTPLSFAQQQVWVHAHLAPDLPLYNEPVTIRRLGPLDVAALEQSLAGILRRHEAWRTIFPLEDGHPVQVVQPPPPVRLPLVDLRDVAAGEREAEALRLAREDAVRPFDLERGPLLRALLVRLDDDDHRLFLTLHHIVHDGVSLFQLLLPELTALYDTCTGAGAPALPELPLQYPDFAAWQREVLQGPRPRGLDYWKRRLGGTRPRLELPTDRPRPPLQSFRGRRQLLGLPGGLVESLKALAQRERVTLFMTLLAGFATLLHRYTGQCELVIGTVSAGRSAPGVGSLLGFFANPLALRLDLSGDPSVRELFGRVRDTVLEALAHDETPFELVVGQLGPDRDPGRNPLFQAALSLEARAATAHPGWDITPLDIDTGTAKFDLYLELRDRADGLTGRCEYSTDLFDATSIERFLRHYRAVLESLAADPGRRLAALPLLDDAERHRLLDWGRRRAPYPETATVHEVFAARAAEAPQAEALVLGEERLTYAELDRRANRLAHRLRELGVAPDVLVGVCLERSIDLVVALLGILKAGGAYLPLDTGYPAHRLRFMLDDSGARVILTRAELGARLGHHGLATILLDPASHDEPGEASRLDAAGAGPDHLAYVMYTSGSTGQPKGVAITHRGILRLVFGQTYARLDATRTLLQLAPISFDASTFEIWGALLHGGRCVLFPAAVPTPAGLAEVMRRHGVTTLWLTASLFNTVIDEAPETLAGVEEVLTGGEALSPAHVRRACTRLPGITIVNGYGPTESTTFACCHRICHPPEPTAAIPIGQPIANTEVYVLDRHRNLAPLGASGELYVGGPGLARGYVGRPELTAERFVSHPFDATPGARLYRTGDLVRWRADGQLQFLGRLDLQLKIRGFRVEPGEIEAVLAEHPCVREAAVVARQRPSGERVLVAYVVTRPEGPAGDAGTLREFLKTRLPAWMVPSAFVELPALPLTPAGKVDRAGLAVREAPVAAARRLPPRDPLEAQLVALWEDVLGVGPIGVRDDFFALGGHSLAAVRIVQRIERNLGPALALSTFYTDPTVEDLARVLLRQDRQRLRSPVLRLQEAGSRRPLLFFHGDVNGGGFYCRDLARHLGADQPLFAVHPLGLDGRRVPATIEAMAAEHLETVRRLQPHGPYFIGGYCNGGLLAYEVARRLAASGEAVDMVVLIAAAADRRLRGLWPVADRLGRMLRLQEDEAVEYFARLRCVADRLVGMSPRQRVAATLNAASRLALEIGLRLHGARRTPLEPGWMERDDGTAVRVADGLLREATYARYFTAVMAYVPRPFPGRLLVFWPDEEPLRPAGDPLLGWRPLVEQVEVVRVPGDHQTVITRHVELIARNVRARRAPDAETAELAPAV